MVAAIAISGKLGFNPITDTLVTSMGRRSNYEPPTGMSYQQKDLQLKTMDIKLQRKKGTKSSGSTRLCSSLQLLYLAHGMVVILTGAIKMLIKAHGKCTTDHISMAGPWLIVTRAFR